MNTEHEYRFARIAHSLEPDLARATRDLPQATPRPRPGLSTLIIASPGLAAPVFVPTELPTVPWLYTIALLAALTYLTQLTRAVAHDWTAP